MSRAAAAVALLVLAACTATPPPEAPPAAAPARAIPESAIGLRSADVLEPTETVPAHPVDAAPGASRPRPPAHPEAPPVIPHSVEGLLPLTLEENSCLACHEPAGDGGADAPAVPASHLEGGRLDPRRQPCVACHVAQTDAPPLVENRFRP